MCKTASFWHNPINGDIAVYDLSSHSVTQEHLKLNQQIWREGHYLPSGEIECRIAAADRITQADCNERMRNRFPTFFDFLTWALNQKITGSLDLSGLTSPPKGIVLPEKITGYLYLSDKVKLQWNKIKASAARANCATKSKPRN